VKGDKTSWQDGTLCKQKEKSFQSQQVGLVSGARTVRIQAQKEATCGTVKQKGEKIQHVSKGHEGLKTDVSPNHHPTKCGGKSAYNGKTTNCDEQGGTDPS